MKSNSQRRPIKLHVEDVMIYRDVDCEVRKCEVPHGSTSWVSE